MFPQADARLFGQASENPAEAMMHESVLFREIMSSGTAPVPYRKRRRALQLAENARIMPFGLGSRISHASKEKSS